MISNYMKEKIMKSFLLLAFIFGFVALTPSVCLASSFIFQNKVITVPVGQSFSVPIAIDPAGDAQYTVRLSAEFSTDEIEVLSFLFDPDWMVVSQPSYDLEDNENGKLIKTAGFPSGFTNSENFGTITFIAKQAGESIITVGSEAFILNVKSESSLQSRPQVRLIVTQATTSLQEPVEAPQVVPVVDSLPDLPVEAENLFDIISEPVRHTTPRPIWFSAFLFSIVLFLIIIVIFILGNYIRNRFNSKSKDINKKL